MLLMALLAAQAGSGEVVLRHSLGPNYTNVEVESACGSHIVRFHFRNESVREPRGRIASVRIDNEEVPGAVAQLQARVAGRFIDRVGIMNCGFDERNPVVMGAMEFSALESQRERLPSRVFFRLRRDGGAWRMVLDGSGSN